MDIQELFACYGMCSKSSKEKVVASEGKESNHQFKEVAEVVRIANDASTVFTANWISTLTYTDKVRNNLERILGVEDER